MMADIPDQTEGPVQSAILELLELHPMVVVVARTNAGRRGGAQLAPEGWADITGMLRGGWFFVVECKRPGGKPRPGQRDFRERVLGAGGFALVADDVQQVADWLRRVEREIARRGK